MSGWARFLRWARVGGLILIMFGLSPLFSLDLWHTFALDLGLLIIFTSIVDEVVERLGGE